MGSLLAHGEVPVTLLKGLDGVDAPARLLLLACSSVRIMGNM